MPELPEVTTIIGILKPYIINKTIKKMELLYPRLVTSDKKEFVSKLEGKTFLDITRKGKFIIFHLSDNLVVISHLRMEGKYSYLNEEEANPLHTEAIFHLTDNTKLVYFDTRKFGKMKLSTENKYELEDPILKLGIEPMDVNDSNKSQIYKGLSRKKHIKLLLLDQTIMAGIGNIYADEICYACKINPLTLGSELKVSDYDNIIKSASEILQEAIKQGGSTIKSYHPKEGVDGKFQVLLKAYGHNGKRCTICGTKFHKIFLGGRGTTYCPNCQIDHNLQKAIGITGPIGSGKSTVLNYFEKKGYEVVSCDEIVNDLYQDPLFVKKIIKLFGSKIIRNGVVDKQLIRLMISNDKALHSALEDLIFPIVEEKIVKEISLKNNLVIEVPLLFKAHYQYLFKKIFFIDSPKSILQERLKNRNYKNIDQAIDLYYKNNSFNQNENVIRIENDTNSIEDLERKIDKYI